MKLHIRSQGAVGLAGAAGGVLLLCALLLSCSPQKVEEPFEPSSSYLEYRSALERLGLDGTDLGRSWILSGEEALRRPVQVVTPFEEAMLLDPQAPAAIAYVFEARRGQAVTVSFRTEMDAYFADLFRVDGQALEGAASELPAPVASRPRGAGEIRIEVRQDGYYLLRVQPELLRGGSFDVSIVATASLAFPVEGADPSDIWSFYGDPRDGGRRIHEGIDIFAARGTPALAVADAVVSSVRIGGLGGKTVSLRLLEQGITVYYAHLDEQLVERGQRVDRGEIVGRVGNTGNAATTPPHLHLGIYEGAWRQDVDPWDYVVDPPRVRPPVATGKDLAGRWMRTVRETALGAALPAPARTSSLRNRARQGSSLGAGDSRARAAQDTAETTLAKTRELLGSLAAPLPLEADSPVHVLGAAGGLVRVRTPLGHEGFVDPADLGEALGGYALPLAAAVREPWSGDAFVGPGASSPASLLGREAGRTYVMLESGRVGYVLLQ